MSNTFVHKCNIKLLWASTKCFLSESQNNNLAWYDVLCNVLYICMFWHVLWGCVSNGRQDDVCFMGFPLLFFIWRFQKAFSFVLQIHTRWSWLHYCSAAASLHLQLLTQKGVLRFTNYSAAKVTPQPASFCDILLHCFYTFIRVNMIFPTSLVLEASCRTARTVGTLCTCSDTITAITSFNSAITEHT